MLLDYCYSFQTGLFLAFLLLPSILLAAPCGIQGPVHISSLIFFLF